MVQKPHDTPTIPSGTKYLAAWLTTQIVVNLPWLAPWLTNQIRAAQNVDATLSAPDASKAIYAGIALVVSTLLCFAHKVWKELEADAVRGSANLIRAAPGMARELVGRCGDAVWGFCTRWFIRWGFTRRYLADLRYRYGLFNDKGLGLINANRIDLDKVYVELMANPDVNLNNPNFNPVSREIRDRASLWEHLRTLRPGFAMAVVGAPGSGKTTLLHHMMLTCAQGHQWRRRARFRLPIFIELRKVATELKNDPRRDPDLPKLIETLWKKDSRNTEMSKRLPKGWLAARLRSGRCLLLWDGLDEVADSAQRLRVRDYLESKVIGDANYRSNISIVSARPAGYRDAPLDHAQVLEVQPFDWQDTKHFVHQWYHATEVTTSGNVDNATTRRRAAEESDALLRCLQDSPKLGDLAVNPLLLTMVCMVHRYRGALPGSRSQLFDEICQVLLERWRQQRGMADRYLSQQKLEVLRPLAVWMMQNQVKDISESDMLPLISDPLTRIGVPAGKEAALAFIHELRDSSGLWLEKELNTWGFAHLSFQEHLCADAWARAEGIRPEKWSQLLSDAWWRETLLLYAVKAADATPLAEAAMDGDSACRAFALQLLDETINLTATARQRMETSLVHAISSRDETVFLPAAEAWLLRQQERNYKRLDDDRQISDWVTQAEYQLFMLDAPAKERGFSTPLHWTSAWFSCGHEMPIAGLSGKQSEEFCEWLDRRFPLWKHSLPSNQQELVAVPTARLDMLAWMKNNNTGIFSLQTAAPVRQSAEGPQSYDPRVLEVDVDRDRGFDHFWRSFSIVIAMVILFLLALRLVPGIAFVPGITFVPGIAFAIVLPLTIYFIYARDRDFARRIRLSAADKRQVFAFNTARACALGTDDDNFHVGNVDLALALAAALDLDLDLDFGLDLDFDLLGTRSVIEQIGILSFFVADTWDGKVNFDVAGARAHYIALKLAIAFDHKASDATANAYRQKLYYASVLDLAHCRALNRLDGHALDRVKAREYVDLVVYRLNRGFGSARSERFLQDELTSLGPSERRRLYILKSLQPALADDSDAIVLRSSFRRYYAACFKAIREHGPKHIPPMFVSDESAIRLLIAREEGAVPAWEGLRVVREHRK